MFGGRNFKVVPHSGYGMASVPFFKSGFTVRIQSKSRDKAGKKNVGFRNAHTLTLGCSLLSVLYLKRELAI